MRNFLIPKSDLPFGRIFDDFDSFFNSVRTESSVLFTDVKEYPSYYLLEIEAPGISKNNLDISFENGYLTVSYSKTDKHDGTIDVWKYLKRERAVSASRRFYVGEVNDSEIKATYNDGVLYVHVPKCLEEDCSSAKKIEIHQPGDKIKDTI